MAKRNEKKFFATIVIPFLFFCLFLCSRGVNCSYSEYSCCNPHDSEGCANYQIEEFVCEKSIYCCTIAWDEECVQQAVSTNAFSEYLYSDAKYSTFYTMPEKRYLNTAAFLFEGDFLYIIGGQFSSSTSSRTTQVNSIQLSTGTVSTLAPLNLARASPAVAYYNGNIYVFGGYGYNPSILLNSYEIYNIESNTWTLGSATLPNGDEFMSAIVVPEEEMIYIVGGKYFNSFLEFSITEDYISAFPEPADAHIQPSLSYDPINYRLYVFGGTSTGASEYYDFSNGKWVPFATSFPDGYYSGFTNYGNYTTFMVTDTTLSAAQLGLDYTFNPVLTLPEDGYAVGVYNTSGYQLVYAGLNYIYRISLPIVQSKKINSTMTARYGLVAETVLDDLILTVGGVASTGVSNLNQAYNSTSNEWFNLAPMPTHRYGMSSVVVENKVYLFGGYDRGSKVLNTTEVYDPITNKWLALPGMPTARVYSSASYYYGLIYVFGGYNEYMGGALKVVEVFDVSKSTWATFTSLPYPLYGHVSYESGGLIYLYQGKGNPYPTQVYQLTPYTKVISKYTGVVPPAFLGTVCEFNGVAFFQGGLSWYDVPQNYNGFFYNNTIATTPQYYFVPMENFSEARAVGASAVAKGSCYIFGGIDSRELFLSSIDIIYIANSVCN